LSQKRLTLPSAPPIATHRYAMFIIFLRIIFRRSHQR
jgi:hypothetical protein